MKIWTLSGFVLLRLRMEGCCVTVVWRRHVVLVMVINVGTAVSSVSVSLYLISSSSRPTSTELQQL